VAVDQPLLQSRKLNTTPSLVVLQHFPKIILELPFQCLIHNSCCALISPEKIQFFHRMQDGLGFRLGWVVDREVQRLPQLRSMLQLGSFKNANGISHLAVLYLWMPLTLLFLKLGFRLVASRCFGSGGGFI
jgi:hypothetical protein